ncbi:MAG TPA: hypothetical protein VGC08_03940 [Pedobacter sp.]
MKSLKLLTLLEFGMVMILLSCTFKKDLKESETFYLWTMLMHARRTTQPFNKKYDLLFEYYGKPEPSAIETDGQRFKFTGKNKARTEFDLGFNFISKNGEVFMLRDKPDYY